MRSWLGRMWSARAAALPRREGWGGLLLSFSGYSMCACLLATAVAKADNVFELGVDRPALVLAWSLLADVLVFLGLAGAFALAEARWRRAEWVTGTLAVVVGLYVAANTAYLVLAGEQGSWQSIVALRNQSDDVQMVLEEASSGVAVISVLGTLLVLAAVPVGLRRLSTARGGGEGGRRRMGHLRAAAALPTAMVAGLGLVALPGPGALDASILGQNSVLKLIRTAVAVWDSGDFAGWPVQSLVEDAALERFAARAQRPNVLVVVLESTRYDHTTLSGASAHAATPHLAGLAEHALVAHRARAVVPHTTKSLFTLLCARYPTLQRGVIEVSANADVECLPDVLHRAGYRTGFFQSAFGTFEQRARLVRNLGFAHFEAWESIQGRKLGYLASADSSMLAPFRAWLDQAPTQPFFATVLTSATHHPYRLPPTLRRSAQQDGLPMATPAERYARLVEAEDRLLGGLLEALAERGLRERTLVVVVGDHGEGFGDHGVKQHDNNFYEEGLRVPFVIAGPAVEPAQRHENVSLLDLTPTLLGLLELPLAEAARPDLPGRDLSASGVLDDRPLFFACYSTWRCRGFVIDDRKVVYVPEDDALWYFDLASDPQEQSPRLLTPDLEKGVEAVHELVEQHTTREWDAVYEPVEGYGRWRCPQDEGICLHPRAYKPEHRYEATASGREDGSRPRAGNRQGHAEDP